jgi:hypothetical protein
LFARFPPDSLMRHGSFVLMLFCAAPVAAGDFGPEALAFLQKHCVACHGEKTKKSGIALHMVTDDAGVLGNRKTLNSVLKVLDAGEMPPKEKPQPKVEEVEAFKKAVTQTFAAADKNAKPDPGRVTVRRLNKTEYANTIRDLVGVDFNPAEDFPADDIGYGFDNIGDVLTLSPVLMERYLSAAEAIVQRAIVPTPPKVPQRWVGGKYLEPATDPNKVGKFRAITKGNLNSNYSLSMAGDYVFHVRAYATNAGDGLKASITVDGNEITSFVLKDGDEKKVHIEDVKLTLKKGEHRIAVALSNPAKDDKGERTLHIENFMLEGPADTRPETQKRLLACDASKSKHDQAVEIMTRFATQAYRRPATATSSRREFRWRWRQCWCRRSSCSASNSTIAPTRPTRMRSTNINWLRGCRTSSGQRCRTTS